MGFGLSGTDYEGNFDFYTQLVLIVGLIQLIPVVLLGFTVSETAPDRCSLREALCQI